MKFAKCHPERKYCAKGLCKQCYQNKRNAETLDYRSEWAGNNPESRTVSLLKYKLMKQYGLSLKEYYVLLMVQCGKCYICGSTPVLPDRLHVDHDHETGRVRGLLCFSCNSGLGNFKDSLGLLVGAAEYLERVA